MHLTKRAASLESFCYQKTCSLKGAAEPFTILQQRTDTASPLHAWRGKREESGRRPRPSLRSPRIRGQLAPPLAQFPETPPPPAVRTAATLFSGARLNRRALAGEETPPARPPNMAPACKCPISTPSGRPHHRLAAPRATRGGTQGQSELPFHGRMIRVALAFIRISMAKAESQWERAVLMTSERGAGNASRGCLL